MAEQYTESYETARPLHNTRVYGRGCFWLSYLLIPLAVLFAVGGVILVTTCGLSFLGVFLPFTINLIANGFIYLFQDRKCTLFYDAENQTLSVSQRRSFLCVLLCFCCVSKEKRSTWNVSDIARIFQIQYCPCMNDSRAISIVFTSGKTFTTSSTFPGDQLTDFLMPINAQLSETNAALFKAAAAYLVPDLRRKKLRIYPVETEEKEMTTSTDGNTNNSSEIDLHSSPSPTDRFADSDYKPRELPVAQHDSHSDDRL